MQCEIGGERYRKTLAVSCGQAILYRLCVESRYSPGLKSNRLPKLGASNFVAHQLNLACRLSLLSPTTFSITHCKKTLNAFMSLSSLWNNANIEH